MPMTTVSRRANCSMRSRKPQASAVQPPVIALGKKYSTTCFFPFRSFRLSFFASFLSGRTVPTLVAGSSMSGAGLPSSTLGASANRARQSRGAYMRLLLVAGDGGDILRGGASAVHKEAQIHVPLTGRYNSAEEGYRQGVIGPGPTWRASPCDGPRPRAGASR